MDTNILTLVIEALTARADQKSRAAQRGAQQVADMKHAGRDVRSSSVTLVMELADAQALADVATGLASGSLHITSDVKGTDEVEDTGHVDVTAEQQLGPDELPGPVSEAAAAEVLENLTTADE